MISDIERKLAYQLQPLLSVEMDTLNGKEFEKYCKLYEEENRKILGVALQSVATYEVDPEVKFQFEEN